eukprot:scaffold5021_cov123-Isochrysis_galbana.AAC.11
MAQQRRAPSAWSSGVSLASPSLCISIGRAWMGRGASALARLWASSCVMWRPFAFVFGLWGAQARRWL